MITLARAGWITGTALPNSCASLRQVQKPPSSPAGEHITLFMSSMLLISSNASAVLSLLAQALSADPPAGAWLMTT